MLALAHIISVIIKWSCVNQWIYTHMVKILSKTPRQQSKLWHLTCWQETHCPPAVTVIPLTPHTVNADVMIICMIIVTRVEGFQMCPHHCTLSWAPASPLSVMSSCFVQYFNFNLTPVGFHYEHILVYFEIYAAAAKNSYLNPFSFYFVMFYMKQVHTWGEGTFKCHSLLLWGNWCIDP